MDKCRIFLLLEYTRGVFGVYNSQLFQRSILITDIATYRLNQPGDQCSENHQKCIARWEGRDGVTITIFFQHTRDGHETSYL